MKNLIMFLALAFTAPAAFAAPTHFETNKDETVMQTDQTNTPNNTPAPRYSNATVVKAAQAAHEANRVYCAALGDTSQVPWEDAPEWQWESCIAGACGVLIDGNTPEQSHSAWLKHKVADGWTYGPVKDPAAKTHPCLVSYDQLPPEQRAKDHIFVSVVSAVADALEPRTLSEIDVVPGLPETIGQQPKTDPVAWTSFGQLAHDSFARALGSKSNWNAAPAKIKEAWDVAAYDVRLAPSCTSMPPAGS